MRILAVTGQRDYMGAVEIYRISMPLTYLNKRSDMKCGWLPRGNLGTMLAQKQTEILRQDVIVLHKFLSSRMPDGYLDKLRALGAKLVYETDDDYSGRYRPADDVNDGTWHDFLNRVDAITVSTDHLAELARKDSGGKPVYVCPNAIQLDYFRKMSMETDNIFPEKLTIMLAGTRTHQLDWQVVNEVMPDILADYPEVEFLAACEKQHYENLNAQFVKPVLYQYYPALLRQADILCAPLVPEDGFNWSKSPIKAIEGWSAERQITDTRTGGCAIVASKAAPYKGVVENRHNGLLVDHTPDAWDKALRKLVGDELLRHKLQYEGLKDARRYDIEDRWVDWYRAYKAIGGLS